VNIRQFRKGDEAAQIDIYNTAAAPLPGFKPSTVAEIVRRTRKDFDPASRFFAEVDGRVVGYAGFHPNGRVSLPWTLPGFEACAEPLYARVEDAMRARGLSGAFAAYRADWPSVHAFFEQRGFRKARAMVNYIIDLLDMPTPSARPSSSLAPVTSDDVPAILAMGAQALRVQTAAELERHLFKNPFFTAQSLFCLRSRSDGSPLGVGILIYDPHFANPRAVDSAMPCFRLGAFGCENMQTKRISGLFSFLTKPDANVSAVGMDLMGQAAARASQYDDVDCLAAQVASDTPLAAFYQRHFRLQGSFPVFEKSFA